MTSAKGKLSREGIISPQLFGITEELAYYGDCLIPVFSPKGKDSTKEANKLFISTTHTQKKTNCQKSIANIILNDKRLSALPLQSAKVQGCPHYHSSFKTMLEVLDKCCMILPT